jgi:hypothetical protein
MSRGIQYLGLLGALRDEDILREARGRQRSTDTIRRRRGRTLGATLLRVLTGKKN